jgi:HlyD family secretion protein
MRMRRLSIGFVVAVVVLGGLLVAKAIAQRVAEMGPAKGSGVVEGTTLRLASRVGGRVASVEVREGQEVAEGDLLVRLDCIEARATLAEVEARVGAAKEQAHAAVEGAEAARSAAGAASAQARAASAQVRAVDAQGQAAGRQADRLNNVLDDVSASMRDQARAQADGLIAQAEAAEASRRAGQAQARAASGQANAASAQAAAAELQATAAAAALDKARLAVAECEVVAPRDGIVELLPFEVGELVGPGMPLVTLVDVREAIASFYLPNADLAAARPGGTAEVRADAWPDRVFTGRVATVASHAEFTPRNIQTRTDRDRLVYRVEVDVDNEDGALRPGMPVEVTLVETP